MRLAAPLARGKIVGATFTSTAPSARPAPAQRARKRPASARPQRPPDATSRKITLRMSDAPANPKKFRLSPGGEIGFDENDARVAVAWPEFNERPEDELLGRLKESGATFPDEAVALEIIRTSDLFERAGQLESNQSLSRLIHQLTHGKCNRKILEMIHLSAFQLHLPGYRTQNDLADKLKVSQGRVSQLISKIAKNR